MASDDPLSRDAFKAASVAPGIELLAAANIVSVTERLAELAVDVVVLDAPQSAVDLLTTLGRLRTLAPDARIVVFSNPESNEFGVLCLCTGASGYLSKDIDLSALGRIVRGVGRGEAVVSRALATELIARMRDGQRRGGEGPLSAVTAREGRLLQLLRAGHTLETAAAELGVAQPTARRHLASARRKLLAGSGGLGVRRNGVPHHHSSLEDS
ncbi:MAG: response regulator [Solirubrobacteraceae bacterium]